MHRRGFLSLLPLPFIRRFLPSPRKPALALHPDAFAMAMAPLEPMGTITAMDASGFTVDWTMTDGLARTFNTETGEVTEV